MNFLGFLILQASDLKNILLWRTQSVDNWKNLLKNLGDPDNLKYSSEPMIVANKIYILQKIKNLDFSLKKLIWFKHGCKRKIFWLDVLEFSRLCTHILNYDKESVHFHFIWVYLDVITSWFKIFTFLWLILW